MKQSLRFKLTSAFLFITLIAFTLMGVFANLLLEKQFENYIIKNINDNNNQIVVTLESQYNATNQGWSLPEIESLGVSALGDGLMLRVSGQDGTILWDAMKHNSGLCAQILQSMAENMKDRNTQFNGGYTEKSYDLTAKGEVVGKAAIGYYGPYFYTDNDLAFLNTLNKLLIFATGIAAVLSVLLGFYFAKHLTTPISKVINSAGEISRGNYKHRVKTTSNTREMIELTNAINTLAESLGKQETLRKRLTADVAHELRTPIANLQGHLEAMIDGIWQPDAQRLNSCHEETIRLSNIVLDLETLTQYDRETMTLNKEQFSLLELTETIASVFKKEIQDKQIKLKIDVPNIQIKADRDRFSQVLVNLLSNAFKYTNSDGQVEIKAHENEEEIILALKDSGIGISDDDLPYIFERFYRADKSRNRETGGSGIGLAIAKSLIEAHGGTISVNSTLGCGSEFVISLPK